jgi:hypothetical protein
MSVADTVLVRRQRSPHQKPQSDYVACPDHPPAFVGHTETLDADWQRFRETFAPEVAAVDRTHPVPELLPHRHDKLQRDKGSRAAQDVRTNLGPPLTDRWCVMASLRCVVRLCGDVVL